MEALHEAETGLGSAAVISTMTTSALRVLQQLVRHLLAAEFLQAEAGLATIDPAKLAQRAKDKTAIERQLLSELGMLVSAALSIPELRSWYYFESDSLVRSSDEMRIRYSSAPTGFRISPDADGYQTASLADWYALVSELVDFLTSDR